MIQIQLDSDTEKRLRDLANTHGSPVEDYVSRLVLEHVNNGDETSTDLARTQRISAREVRFQEILGPVHQQFKESGMTEDELDEIIEKIRNDVYRERHPVAAS